MTEAVQMGAQVRRILELGVLDNIARMKISGWDSYDETMDAIEKKIEGEFQSLLQEVSESGLVFQETAQ
jgi:hypothetical protein